MTLQLLHYEFPYIWGKFDFLFYQRSFDPETRFIWKMKPCESIHVWLLLPLPPPPSRIRQIRHSSPLHPIHLQPPPLPTPPATWVPPSTPFIKLPTSIKSWRLPHAKRYEGSREKTLCCHWHNLHCNFAIAFSFLCCMTAWHSAF